MLTYSPEIKAPSPVNILFNVAGVLSYYILNLILKEKEKTDTKLGINRTQFSVGFISIF